MKVIKGIGLFVIYPCMMFGLGVCMGLFLNDFFYPGAREGRQQTEYLAESAETDGTEAALTSAGEEVLNDRTAYVIEEYDVGRDTLAESTWKLPAKYVGMDRETFVSCMEFYTLSPPLSELERGFLSAEVRTFSPQRVVVRMNYDYVKPTESFYLRVEDNLVVVYCDDGKTVYLNTDISAQKLPEEVRHEIIMGMYVEDEAALYHFLETYSS